MLLWWRLAVFFLVPTETNVFKAFIGRWEIPSESSFSQGRAGKAREPCRVQTPSGGGIDGHDWAFGRDILVRVRNRHQRPGREGLTKDLLYESNDSREMEKCSISPLSPLESVDGRERYRIGHAASFSTGDGGR